MKYPEKYRVQFPVMPPSGAGKPGCFQIPRNIARKHTLNIIASEGGGWDHVSVSVGNSIITPTWEDMCLVKQLFWDEEEAVIQYHPPKSEYVNNHPGCLHLWKKQNYDIPLPPSLMVGFK